MSFKSKESFLTLTASLLAIPMLLFSEETVPVEEAEKWQIEDAPVRAVYLQDDTEHSTVELPLRLAAGSPFKGLAAFSGSRRLPVKEIARDETTITAVVDGSTVPDGTEIALYASPAPHPGAPAFTNANPVHFRVTQTGVFEAPPTVDDMVAMADGHPRHDVFEFDIPTIGYLKSDRGSEKRNWHRSNWRNFTYLAEYSGLLLIPEKGEYRFATAKRATGPVYFFLDGKLAIDVPNRGMAPLPDRPKQAKRAAQAGKSAPDASPPPDPEWIFGETVLLEKGLVPFRLLTYCKRFCEVTLGWLPPGETEEARAVPLPDTVWASARPPRAVRLDYRDSKEPFATAIALVPKPEDSYRFDGVDSVFLPVRLTSLHPRSPAFSGALCSWHWPSAPSNGVTGDVIDAVVVREGADTPPPSVQLTVRNERLRHTARATRKIPFPSRASILHRLTAELKNIEPFSYRSDRVRPELEVRTTLPDGTPLLARVVLRKDTNGQGGAQVIEGPLAPVKSWCRLSLPEWRVGGIASIDWEILHAGSVVAKGRTVFEAAPFGRAPDGARGDDLLIGSDPIVLVPRNHRLPSSSPGRPGNGKLVLLDGFATPAGGFDDKAMASIGSRLAASGERLSTEVLRSGERQGEVGRNRQGLAFAAHLSSLDRPSLLVIAPDFQETVLGAPLERFERHLASLTAIAKDVLKTRVLLLTPPPGLLSASALAPLPDMRPYAEAVHRVADAYGVPVADLYTLCRTRSIDAVAPDGTLTPEGADLIGELLVKNLHPDRYSP